jgi:tRNA G26 N,N-dimethylase Trm1
VANDIDPAATEAIKKNVEFAGPVASSIVAMCADARVIMLQCDKV